MQPVIFFLTPNIFLSDARTRVNLPDIPGDPLSSYINANFLKVSWRIEQLTLQSYNHVDTEVRL